MYDFKINTLKFFLTQLLVFHLTQTCNDIHHNLTYLDWQKIVGQAKFVKRLLRLYQNVFSIKVHSKIKVISDIRTI